MKEQLQDLHECPNIRPFRAGMHKLADRGNKEQVSRGESVGKPLKLKKQDIVLKDGNNILGVNKLCK
ncbi:MAG: hypothetical protein V8S14_03475 [Lachnospiraceae bacterium]